ncbi:unnamed protein product [Rotaria socialis]|uniref:Uncharacterized protein n=1 Tax=Rotaria socialis TaxID=392032 RepID=A0A817REQ8_9BILA|nr:unnamed protein product [Rotaria socialis]CAF3411071.1 unnamed protein product [Rotaria socialis]CAF3657064.1 unnamed protein product [Rotaria socialis]CAF4227101.1 unnamed protein product [Rotaria socialis]CAF4405760.1 unnamed protein product [Rotaria socialis]
MGPIEAKLIDCDPKQIRSKLNLDLIDDDPEIEIQHGSNWSVIRFKGEVKSNDLHLSLKITKGKTRGAHLTCEAIEFYLAKHHISFMRSWKEIEQWYDECCRSLNLKRDNKFIDKVEIWHHQMKNCVSIHPQDTDL